MKETLSMSREPDEASEPHGQLAAADGGSRLDGKQRPVGCLSFGDIADRLRRK
jgi:hypothetical protein